MSDAELERPKVVSIETHRGKTEVWTNSYRCNLCGDSGSVVAYKLRLPFAFSCICMVGISKRRSFPIWHSGRLSEYSLAGLDDLRPMGPPSE